jgi:hypothetical protein
MLIYNSDNKKHMKQSTNWLSLFTLLLLYNIGFAQTPGGINYQGVARSQFLVGLNNDSIQLRFTIKEKSVLGPVLYTETRGTRTDSFGVFNVVIGAANAISQSGNIKLVPWSDTTKKFLMVEMNILDPNTPGFLNMGTTQLLSVPFSFYSDISDSSRIAAKADTAKFSNASGNYYFSATMAPFHSQTLPNGSDETFNVPIYFPVAQFNEGNHYDTATSEFTAPDSGFYAFEVSLFEWMIDYDGSISSNYSINLTFAIVKNGKAVRLFGEYYRRYDTNNTNQDYSRSEGTYHGQSRLKLKKGDKVAIKVANGTSGNLVKIGLNLDSDPEELEYFNSNFEMPAFAEFSGYKIK